MMRGNFSRAERFERIGMKKMFVTGGNGFVGSRVVRHLVEKGYAVRCLLRETSRTDRIDDLTYEKSFGDVRDRDSVVRGMQGCDGVIHLAGVSSWHDIHSPLMHEVVFQGTENVLRAAEKLGNLRTVYISTLIAVNGTKRPVVQDETSVFTLKGKIYSYAQSKKNAEKLCLRHFEEGLPVVIVNPAEVYGPYDRDLITSGTLVDFANNNPTIVTRGGSSFVYVDDVAAGIVAAMERGTPGERYILGGENLTITQLAQLTLEILGKKHLILKPPNWLMRFISYIGRTFHLSLPVNPASIPYAIYFWYVDNTKAKNELGVEFRSAREMLEPTLKWLVENGFIK
jgi:dihydroflavonol-4-reductase